MFNAEAKVHDTRLFVGKTQDGQWQLTVYANTVDAQDADESFVPSNAMVLPFPVPKGTTTEGINEPHKVASNSDILRVLDFTDYKNFFGDLEACFPQSRSMLSSSSSREYKSRSAPLEVVQIGGYNVSIARTLEFIKNIDKNVFSVHENLYNILKQNYSTGFGFLICSFDTSKKIDSKGSPPLAYVHRMGEKFFVPTRHEHGDEQGGRPFWDHEIFLWNASVEDTSVTRKHTNTAKAIKLQHLSKKLPSPLEKIVSLEKATIMGKRNNEDLAVRAL
jgi:hypothetical protein